MRLEHRPGNPICLARQRESLILSSAICPLAITNGTMIIENASGKGTTMTDQDFLEFVERKTAQANSEKAVDWDERRNEWLQELEDLYEQMEKYLQPYGIEIMRNPVMLEEEYLGAYEAQKLTFAIGRDKIVAKPIGTLLIGARGRVDLSGPRATLKIVLLEKGGLTEHGNATEESSYSMIRRKAEDACWYIATTPPPKRTVIQFNKDSFRDAIMEISGG